MTSIAEAQALVRGGEVVAAARLLDRAAAAGEAQAAFELANWRMAGDLVRRDLAEARRLFGVAADRGHRPAEAPYVALLANGAGGSGRRWREALARLRAAGDLQSASQVALIDAMAIDAEGNPCEPCQWIELSAAPLILGAKALLTPDECKHLAAHAQAALQPAMVVHPASGQLVADPVRRSASAAFPFVRETPVLHAINRRIAAATATAWEQGEPVQVIAYGRGDEYRRHSDALPGAANQRTWTVLVWLTEDFTGGETAFPALGRSFRGRIGDALAFRNTDLRGAPDPLAIHAGLPVTSGRKLILSKWIRQAPLDLAGPPGRPL